MKRPLLLLLAVALLGLGAADPAEASHKHRRSRCYDRSGYDYSSHYRRGCYDRGHHRRGRSSCVFRYYVGGVGADFLCSSYDYG